VKTRTITTELRIHAPFTAFGTFTGIVIMAGIIHLHLSRGISSGLFWTFHPLHVLLLGPAKAKPPCALSVRRRNVLQSYETVAANVTAALLLLDAISAFVTAAMYRLHGNRGLWQTLAVDYVGAIGVATLSDSLIPYAGEFLLDLPPNGWITRDKFDWDKGLREGIG
jgi:hypothetical protein